MVFAFLPYLILAGTYLWLAITGHEKKTEPRLKQKGK
jgi:hypothetical protein